MLKNIKPRTGELCIAAVLLAIAAFVIFEGMRMPFGTLALPGPGYFPIILAVILAAVSVGLLFRKPERSEPVELFHAKGLVTIAAVAAAAVLFEWIGAIPTFGLFLAALFYLLGDARWWIAVVLGAAGASLTWLLFVHLLQLQLPGA
jgi:hypothetical protein